MDAAAHILEGTSLLTVMLYHNIFSKKSPTVMVVTAVIVSKITF